MRYFAYGSNMSLSRLHERAPSARTMGTYALWAHVLRFHKVGKDGSGKCDALYTENPADRVFGVLFDIKNSEKQNLDAVEGLGHGYGEKTVIVHDASGGEVSAVTYYATTIDPTLKPYSWYKNHVLAGARESCLPEDYIEKIGKIAVVED